jgi:hypothetical protein
MGDLPASGIRIAPVAIGAAAALLIVDPVALQATAVLAGSDAPGRYAQGCGARKERSYQGQTNRQFCPLK